MAERDGMWLERVVGVAGAAAAVAVSLLSVSGGSEQKQRPPLDEDDEDYNPLNDPDNDEGLPPVIDSAFKRLGLKDSAVYEHTEGYYAMYRVMKTLGFSDADIAKLVLQKAGERMDEGLEQVHPTEARAVFESMEDAALRAASEVDNRLSLNGDLIRRVREGATAARSGREDLLLGLERGLTQGREQFRRMLKGLSRDDAAE
ncbi:MAG: hypothetical protein AB7R89_27645 [Dehalococcoidia bacterium]